MESRVAILNSAEVVDISEQQVVDCSGDYWNYGCWGGLMPRTYRYARDVGIVSEVDYAYTGVEGTCEDTSSFDIEAQPDGFRYVKYGSPFKLAQALAEGPVSVGVAAYSSTFQLYTEGIITRYCGTWLTHAALVVGYGTDLESGMDYWLLKNSWGDSWGESGYFRVKRTQNEWTAGTCGIHLYGSYPTFPEPVVV